MKLFVVVSAALVVLCQVASGFMIAPSAFAGSSVVSLRAMPVVASCSQVSWVRCRMSYPRTCLSWRGTLGAELFLSGRAWCVVSAFSQELEPFVARLED